jgi:branched-chain amino acid transport system permease protein
VFHIVVNAIISGLAVGSIYGLIAIGYTVIYNGTRIFNLAQGTLVMVAVMLSYFMIVKEGQPQWLTIIVVLAGVSAISLVEERVIVRPFLNRRGGEGIGWFIATLAFASIIQAIVTHLYGDNPPEPVPSPLPSGPIVIGFVHMSWQDVLAVVAFIAVCLALLVFYKRTWVGQAMRATAADRDVAMLRGIDVKRISQLAFLIAGLAAGVGGYVVAPIVYSDPTIGLNYAIKGFIALALGGFGSMRGAIAGALMLGVAEQVYDVYGNANYEVVVGVALLTLSLLVRPTGLFGTLRMREV